MKLTSWKTILQLHAVIAYIGIVLHLFVTKRANLRGDITGLGYKIQCVDGRIADVEKKYIIPGGTAGFSTGGVYYLLALLCKKVPFLQALLLAYFRLNFVNAIIHSAMLVWQLRKNPPREDIVMCSHDNGCGQSTAASPLWFLYFIPNRKAVHIRDWITTLHEWQALPHISWQLLYTQLSSRNGIMLDVTHVETH